MGAGFALLRVVNIAGILWRGELSDELTAASRREETRSMSAVVTRHFESVPPVAHGSIDTGAPRPYIRRRVFLDG